MEEGIKRQRKFCFEDLDFLKMLETSLNKRESTASAISDFDKELLDQSLGDLAEMDLDDIENRTLEELHKSKTNATKGEAEPITIDECQKSLTKHVTNLASTYSDPYGFDEMKTTNLVSVKQVENTRVDN